MKSTKEKKKRFLTLSGVSEQVDIKVQIILMKKRGIVTRSPFHPPFLPPFLPHITNPPTLSHVRRTGLAKASSLYIYTKNRTS